VYIETSIIRDPHDALLQRSSTPSDTFLPGRSEPKTNSWFLSRKHFTYHTSCRTFALVCKRKSPRAISSHHASVQFSVPHGICHPSDRGGVVARRLSTRTRGSSRVSVWYRYKLNRICFAGAWVCLRRQPHWNSRHTSRF
jgi:hypothetical protein